MSASFISEPLICVFELGGYYESTLYALFTCYNTVIIIKFPVIIII